MSTAYEKAKAKYQAVLDADRQDCSMRKNRYATTRHPSTGGNEVVNGVQLTSRSTGRRWSDASTGSASSSSSAGTGFKATRLGGWIKDAMNRPAY